MKNDFYEALGAAIRPHEKNKHILIVIGDFNTKTGSVFSQYKDEIRKYGKGLKNSNGDTLLQLAKEKKLILTNTLFDHKLAHRTTWAAKDRPNDCHQHDGTLRKNPCRNQIDYIISKTNPHKTDYKCKMYGSFSSSADHRLVITSIKFQLCKMNQHKATSKQQNIQYLSDKETRTKHKETLKEKLNAQKEDAKPQIMRTQITKTIPSAAENTIGFKDRQ